jgi:hypothetical protein
MKVYCQQCGCSMNFAGQRPNFCNSCGSNLSTGKKVPQKASAPKKKNPVKEERIEEDFEDENLSVPDISKLDFSLEGSLKVPGTTIGEMSSVSDESQVTAYTPSTTKAPRISKKKFLEEFKSEAGSLRKGK